MLLCRRCGELDGTLIDAHDDRVDRLQKCACRADPPGARTRWVWPNYAFNTALELCFSCVAEVVHTGQLETPLFCATCAPLVEARNSTLAMDASDGPVLRARIPMSRREAEDGEERLGSMRGSGVVQRNLLMGAMTRLKSRRREQVRMIADACFEGMEQIPIADFLAALERVVVLHADCVVGLDRLFATDRSSDPRSFDADDAAPESQRRIDRVPTDYTLGGVALDKVKTRP